MGREENQAIVLHGGAGGVDPNPRVAEEIARGKVNALVPIVEEGWQMLRDGHKALDVVTLVVARLEDDPHFNAGLGGEIARDGVVYLDAGIADGETERFGGVSGVTDVQNPIHAARRVLVEHEDLVFGDRANRIAREVARERGLRVITDPRQLYTPYREELYLKWLEEQKNGAQDKDQHRGGTVGCVVFDGKYPAAGTSTGGWVGQEPNSTGDVPIRRAGTYADKRGAASATGNRSAIIQQGTTGESVRLIERSWPLSLSPQRAARRVMGRINGEAGLIIVDRSGRIGSDTNTGAMPRAYMSNRMHRPYAGTQ